MVASSVLLRTVVFVQQLRWCLTDFMLVGRYSYAASCTVALVLEQRRYVILIDSYVVHISLLRIALIHIHRCIYMCGSLHIL